MHAPATASVMLQAHHRIFTGSIFALDLVLLTVAALCSRELPLSDVPLVPMHWWQHLLLGAALCGTWTIVAVRLDLYHSRRTETMLSELRILVEAQLFALGIAIIVQVAMLSGLGIEPLATLVFATTGLFVHRIVVRSILRILRQRGFNYRQVLIAGHGASAVAISKIVRKNRQYGLRILGSVAFSAEAGPGPEGVRELGEAEQLEEILQEYTVDAVVLCPSRDATSGQVQKVIELCDLIGIVCHFAPSYLTLRNLAPMMVHYGELPVFAFRPGPVAPIRLAIKRGIDLVASTVAILLLSPVLLACAIAIKLEDGGPILFRQVRLGRNARPFLCLKFRSMCADAEAKRREIEAANEQEGPVFKVSRDPRITRVGRFLRKYSLDELPQLFNVAWGEMSLVGPRPPLPSEVVQYDWWQRRRLSVRPGITCIWQVSGRNRITFEEWMAMDLDYIDRWSLALDFKLIARTFGTVVRGTGL